MDFSIKGLDMNRLVLKSVWLNGSKRDILVEQGEFRRIAPERTLSEISPDAQCVDCSHLAIVPAFYNTHTHAAMTILRGLADDVALKVWLEKFIWPKEAKLSAEDIYVASKFAILEMIRSGTVFFADMYWHRMETVRAAQEMGVRASIGVTFADSLKSDSEANVQFLQENVDKFQGRIRLASAPHSIYTNSAKSLLLAAECSEKFQIPLHVHLSETADEAFGSVEPTLGKSPVEFLESLGVLSNRTIAAHVVHVSEKDLEILARRGVTVAHNPCSNMKLASGIFRAKPFLDRGIRLSLGTDGASSNNNLDMREEMKFASLLAKMTSGDPTVLSAGEALKMATKNGAEAFGIHAGEIAEGFLADAVLLDLSAPCFATGDVISNWVYSANSSVIDSVICGGDFLMRHRKIAGSEEIEKEFIGRFGNAF